MEAQIRVIFRPKKNKNMKLKFKKVRDEPWRGARARCQRASKGACFATTPAPSPCLGRVMLEHVANLGLRVRYSQQLGNNLAA